MGITKSEIKMSAINELGSAVDDMLETAQQEMYQAGGAKNALVTAQRKVEELANVVAVDLDEGVIEKLCEEPMEVAKYVNRMIKRAGGVIDNLATTAEVQRIQAVGAAASLKVVVGIAKKMHDREDEKVKAGRAAGVGPEGESPRPTMSAADDIAQRRAEAKAEKEGKSNGKSNGEPKKAAKKKTTRKRRKSTKNAAEPVKLPEVIDISEPDSGPQEPAEATVEETPQEEASKEV
jgi:hypothetical protein